MKQHNNCGKITKLLTNVDNGNGTAFSVKLYYPFKKFFPYFNERYLVVRKELKIQL